MLHLKIITPERVLLDEPADSVTLPTATGEITVLPHHIPLVSNLIAGEIKYVKADIEKFFATSSGTIEVTKSGDVIVLSETAEAGHEIDEHRAETARIRAQKIMQESYKDERSFADAAAGLEKHLTRLKVARKHRSYKKIHAPTTNQ